LQTTSVSSHIYFVFSRQEIVNRRLERELDFVEHLLRLLHRNLVIFRLRLFQILLLSKIIALGSLLQELLLLRNFVGLLLLQENRASLLSFWLVLQMKMVIAILEIAFCEFTSFTALAFLEEGGILFIDVLQNYRLKLFNSLEACLQILIFHVLFPLFFILIWHFNLSLKLGQLLIIEFFWRELFAELDGLQLDFQSSVQAIISILEQTFISL